MGVVNAITESMSCSISHEDHFERIRKKMKKFRKREFTDIKVICQDGSVLLHKIMLLSKVPEMKSLFCELCDHNGETLVILPDTAVDEIEKEIKSLYNDEEVVGLQNLLGLTNRRSIKIESEEMLLNSSNDVDSDNVNDTDLSHLTEVDDIRPEKDEATTDMIDTKLDEKCGENGYLDHTFEILKSNGSISKGVLIVDNMYKYFSKGATTNSKGRELFFYSCSFIKKTKCRAMAVLEDKDDRLQLVTCASNEFHNHEASEASIIAMKIQKEMVDTIKRNPSLTELECYSTIIDRSRDIYSSEEVWNEIMLNMTLKKNFLKSLKRAKQNALGFTDSLISHMKNVEATDTEDLISDIEDLSTRTFEVLS